MIIETYRGYDISEGTNQLEPHNGRKEYSITKNNTNMGPGCVWFKSVKDTKRGIDIFIQSGGGTPDYNNGLFWDLLQKRWANYTKCELCNEMVFVNKLGEFMDDITTAIDLRYGKHCFSPHGCKE
jgi:hypothetical protein